MSEGKSNVPCEVFIVFFFNDTATTEIYTLSLTRRSSDLADIDRMTLMIVFNGKAEDYVKFIPTMEKNIETYISGLMENGSMNSTILPVTLNDVLISLYKDGSVAIPSIEFDKEDKTKLNVSGLSLIKNYKLQGYLTPDETSSLDILRGKVKGGKETILKDGHPKIGRASCRERV